MLEFVKSADGTRSVFLRFHPTRFTFGGRIGLNTKPGCNIIVYDGDEIANSGYWRIWAWARGLSIVSMRQENGKIL